MCLETSCIIAGLSGAHKLHDSMVTPVNRFAYVVGSRVGEEEVAAEYDRCGARWLSLEGGPVPVMLVGKRVASMTVVSDTTSWETCLTL